MSLCVREEEGEEEEEEEGRRSGGRLYGGNKRGFRLVSLKKEGGKGGKEGRGIREKIAG